MATSPDEGRARSSSGTSRNSSTRNAVNAVRVRGKPRISTSKHAAGQSSPDENSLTSFPSLSPSVANSPENNTRHAPPPGSNEDADDDKSLQTGRASSAALQELFNTASEGHRGALFEDNPVQTVPGSLHHMNAAHIEHMIARVGATSLVKQVAQDLAVRDAQVTSIQRRAEERERLLRKMLRECEVSDIDIESRLKELDTDRAKDRKASGKSFASQSSLQSGTSINEQLEEAFEDVWAGQEVSSGESEVFRTSSGAIAGLKSTLKATETHPLDDGTMKNKSAAARGWRNLFGTNEHTTKQSDPAKVAIRITETAQQKLSAIHTASQKNSKRRALSSDLFQPPPHTDDESSVTTASDNENDIAPMERTPTSDSGTGSVRSSTSVTSWALKLVGAGGTSGGGGSNSQIDQKPRIARERHAALNSLSGKEVRDSSPLARATKVQQNEQPATKHPKTRAASIAIGPNGTLKRLNAEHRNTAGLLMVGSPNQGSAATTDEQGPTEMETILPDEIRPPTLAPQDLSLGGTGLLTDRFGFIYDQNRRTREAYKGKHGNRIETLENHRRSFNSATMSEDSASINSHLSADKRPVSPPSATSLVDQATPKRWQDYLKLSVIGSGELLSHTPSAVPITDIVTGNGPETPKKAPPTISISKDGLDVNTKPEPTPSKVSSENAAPILRIDQGGTAAGTTDEPDSVKSLLDQLTEVHDTLQREKTTRWDDFLRKIRTERARNGELGAAIGRRSKHSGVPEASWTDGEVIGIASFGNEGKVGRAKWLEFKNLVLGGIPVSYRAKIWAECSGASGLRIPGYYDELVANEQADDGNIVNQIKMDIGRTLTDNIFFRKGQGLQKLEEILLAYARRNPDIGYCQGMNMITANLLLIMPTAEETFWVLVAMIEYILPDKYYDQSLLASRADQTVLRDYVTGILPQLSAHLESLNIDLEALTFQWFLAVFTGPLSAEALFRVWDVVLCTQDGATFLFQLALALLKLNERNLLSCDSPSQVYTYINHHMTDHAVSIDGLIRASEGLKKFVKREDVLKRRAVAIAIELDANRERDAMRKGKARASKTMTFDSSVLEDQTKGETLVTNADQARGVSVISVVNTEQNDVYKDGLEYRSPMPVEEEVEWRA